MIFPTVFRRSSILSSFKFTRYSSNAKTTATNTKIKTTDQITKNKINIPKRIHRSPTAILEALASTVSKEPTGPHYKYIDDPFFIPASNVSKRSFALAKESGRKAARWIFNQNPQLFEIVDSDPKSEAFLPTPTFDENSDVTEETLKNCIEKRWVQNSHTVYQRLQQKKIAVSAELKQSLLELLCFHNSKDPAHEENIEEKWYSLPPKERRKTWQDGDLAEQLFNAMEGKTAEAYCAMIRGKAKYFDPEHAYALYKEMQDKQLFTDVTTYNYLIPLSVALRDSSEMKWKLCEEFLYNMQREGVKPNLETFNSVLEVLGKISRWRQSKILALETIGEMKSLGIEPSLASYYYLLNINCRDFGPINTILYDIMNIIEGKEFTIRDSRDVLFFVTAMGVCHNHLMDKDLALRLNELLKVGNNYNLLGESLRESVYYQHLFKLLCFTDTLEDFFTFYRKYVPNAYSPEQNVMLEIVQSIEMNSAWEFIPQIWTDIVAFDHFKDSILKKVLNVIGEHPVEGELQQQFFEIAWYIKERLDSQEHDRIRNIINWTGEMMSSVMQTCINAKQFDKAWEVLKQSQDNQSKIIGTLNEKVLSNFLNVCVEASDLKKSMSCLRYMSDAGFSNMKYTEVVYKLPLSDTEKSKVRHLMGSREIYNSPEDNKK